MEHPEGTEAHLKFGFLLEVFEANRNPLSTLATSKILGRIGLFLNLLEFLVLQPLSAHFLLGTDYCDQFWDAIIRGRDFTS